MVTLDWDVAAAVQRLRRDEGVGPSEPMNRLARAGLTANRAPHRFHQRTVDADLLLDVSNVAGAIELAEGPGHR
jgi:hypothetical protein